MASDACRGKPKVDDKNMRRTLSDGKEMGKCSLGKEKNIMQLVMESEKAEFRLEMGRKRKKITGCTYRALFKVQRVKTVFLDTDETIEGPDAVAADVVGESPDSVVAENLTPLPRSRDGTVHSETLEECGDPTDSNGLMVGSEGLSMAVFDNVVCQPSDGNCFEESCVNRLYTNSSSVKSSSSLQEDSTFSLKLRNSVVSESDMKCMHPKVTETRISPESVNGSHPAIRRSTCSKTISISSDSSEDDLCSCNCAVTKDIGRLCTCKKRVQYSKKSLCEPNADNMVVENKQRESVNENVDLESAQVDVTGHRVTQIANCEGGPYIIATCDKSQSPISVKQDVTRGIFNGRGSFELPDVQNEVDLKSLGKEHSRSKTDNMILELERKCRKRGKKLQHKQHEKIQEFHKIWDEKREQLDKDNGLEKAFIHYMFTEVSVRTERLKCLNDAYLRKIENLKLMKDVELKNLEAEQTAAMIEEKQKVKRWLSTAMLSQC